MSEENLQIEVSAGVVGEESTGWKPAIIVTINGKQVVLAPFNDVWETDDDKAMKFAEWLFGVLVTPAPQFEVAE